MCHSLEELKRLVSRFDGSVAFVINHSGGKDSTRMLGFVRECFPDIPTFAVMADTEFEHQRPIPAIDFARSRCTDFNVSLTVVRNPRRMYLQIVEQRGMFPSAQYRQCTSDLKRGPIEKYIRTLQFRLIFNCMGIRSEESPPRSKLQPLTLNPYLTTKTRTVYNWFPIFEQTLSDVLSWHWENGVPLHPVYVPEFHRDGSAGGYLRRLSCRLCIFLQPIPTCWRSVSTILKPFMPSLNWSRRLASRCSRPEAWCRLQMRHSLSLMPGMPRFVSLFDPFLFAFLSLGPSTMSHLNAAFRQSRPLAFGN